MATLSLREDQIMRLLVEEYSEKQIAITLKIARSTVKSHKETLYEKVGVRSLVGLVKYFNKLKASPQRIESLSGYWLSRFDFEQYVPDPSSPEQRFRCRLRVPSAQ